MKCEHCGNNLGIEDLVCPFCGLENKMARQHNKDMRRYKADYASTKQQVLTNSRRFSSFTVKITVIAVLVALITLTGVALGNSFYIRDAREEKMIRANEQEYRAMIDGFMDRRDYLGLDYYSRVNRLRYRDVLDDYYMVFTVSGDYENFVTNMYYLMDEDSYIERDEAFERIASTVDRIYSAREPASDYEKKNYYNERVTAYIKDMSAHVETLIKGYFNLSDEDMNGFDKLSKAKKQVLLEEGFENGKDEDNDR
ncbi:MAG: zinc ribbon domain-containing protein [Lachnospiraceae bacterium]|nr:zinc ribbon domain-containing protein [Lachnospiraceae bacterium]